MCRKNTENTLDLGVSYPGQKNDNEMEENKHDFGIYKYQALSVISFIFLIEV